MYSNPPLHGALLVKEILGDDALKQRCAAGLHCTSFNGKLTKLTYEPCTCTAC